MKNLLTLSIFTLILTGCSTKSYYTLGNNINVETKVSFTKPIDVVTIEVPRYLEEQIIVREINSFKVELLDDAEWLSPMKKHLTNVLINYLQKSMNNPNVHLYPWDANKTPHKRVSVSIQRFIADKDNVYLEAKYKIYNLESKKTVTKLFKTTVPTTKEVTSMIESMEKSYLELAEKIKNEIIQL